MECPPSQPDHVAGGHDLLAAVAVAQRGRHAVPGVAQAGQFNAAPHGDTGRRQVPAEDALGLSLGQEQQERVGGVTEPQVEHRHRQHPAADVQAQLRSRFPPATSSSVTPRPARTSRVRGWIASARESCTRSRPRSIRRARTPKAASSAASLSPVGPAPTTSTSTSPPVMTPPYDPPPARARRPARRRRRPSAAQQTGAWLHQPVASGAPREQRRATFHATNGRSGRSQGQRSWISLQSRRIIRMAEPRSEDPGNAHVAADLVVLRLNWRGFLTAHNRWFGGRMRMTAPAVLSVGARCGGS